MPRIKPHSRYTVDTRDEAADLVGMLAERQNALNSLTLDMDSRILAVREEFQVRINTAGQDVNDMALALEAWAADHPEEFPKDRKSIDFALGTIGFRKGQFRIKKLARYKTFQAVADHIATIAWAAAKYLKPQKPTLDKEAIIADRQVLSAAEMSALGVSVVQDEKFFVDPKCEKLEQGAVVAA